MQLLLSKSFEFGEHEGLDLIPGEVVKLTFDDKNKKIPHIGWKSVLFKEKNLEANSTEKILFCTFVFSKNKRLNKHNCNM